MVGVGVVGGARGPAQGLSGGVWTSHQGPRLVPDQWDSVALRWGGWPWVGLEGFCSCVPWWASPALGLTLLHFPAGSCLVGPAAVSELGILGPLIL